MASVNFFTLLKQGLHMMPSDNFLCITGADLGPALSGAGPEQINYIMKFIIKINEIHISERPWVNKDSLTSPSYP